jgi:hypothetical protein
LRVEKAISLGRKVLTVGRFAVKARWATILGGLSFLVAAPVAHDASAGIAPPPPCDPNTVPAVKLAGLAKKVVIGKRETFGLEDTTSPANVPGPVEVRMVAKDGKGATFFRGDTNRRGLRIFAIWFRFGDPPARVYASYTEVQPDGTECFREVSQKVSAKDRVYFPSNCDNAKQKPKRIIVSCADGGIQLKSLRWRGWNKKKAKARGKAWVNDCKPYCARGTFHTYPARAQVSKPHFCREERRYLYRRLKIRSRGRSLKVNFGFACGDLF